MTQHSTADPKCVEVRQTITAYAKTDHNETVLSMALEGMIEIEDGVLGDAEAESAARHIETCEACTGWLDVFYPKRAALREDAERRRRIYCCINMDHAINRTTGRQTTFKFVMFRGEDPCWCINDDYSFARHCPWCGERLPDRSFEDAEAAPKKPGA